MTIRQPTEKQRKDRAQLLRKYGITLEAWEHMLEEQQHKCGICTSEINWWTANTDHDHETYQLRRLLCYSCNVGLGFFNDNVARLRAAANYLERYGKKQDSLIESKHRTRVLLVTDYPKWDGLHFIWERRKATNEEWLAELSYRRGYHQGVAEIVRALMVGLGIKDVERYEWVIWKWRRKIATRRPSGLQNCLPPRVESK